MSKYEYGDDTLMEHVFATACDNADAVIFYYLKDGDVQCFTWAEDNASWIILLGLCLFELDDCSKNSLGADGEPMMDV